MEFVRDYIQQILCFGNSLYFKVIALLIKRFSTLMYKVENTITKIYFELLCSLQQKKS